MTDEQTTITVSKSTLERFNTLKEELEDEQPGCPPHNADSFLSSLMDTWGAVDNDKDTPVEYGELPRELEELREEVEDIDPVDYAEIEATVQSAVESVIQQ